MKTVSFADFRKNVSGYLTEVEHGETIVLLRRGKPIAEVVPYSEKPRDEPSWNKNTLRVMDALHIACAVEWKADLFLTADKRQLVAAENAGLFTDFAGDR